jgi:hypothetical protein
LFEIGFDFSLVIKGKVKEHKLVGHLFVFTPKIFFVYPNRFGFSSLRFRLGQFLLHVLGMGILLPEKPDKIKNLLQAVGGEVPDFLYKQFGIGHNYYLTFLY